MDIHVKEQLPQSWWQVADCVDRYEAASRNGPPDLRALVADLAPQCLPAALAELAAVDMEFRWKAARPKAVEAYLCEFPEIPAAPGLAEALIAQEYCLRLRGTNKPTLEEYRQRFPAYDLEKIAGHVKTCMVESDSLGPADGPNAARHEPVPDASPVADPYATVSLANSGTDPRGPAPSKPGVAGPPPEVIGRYIVREELGAGGFGRVYRCYDPELKREVAVKLARADKPSTTRRDGQFVHEARSAARLRHPGIVPVLDAGRTDDGLAYIVYEYVAGQTLHQRIAHGDYTREQAVHWCIEIAEALHYAHGHKIVHRDVAPANVIIDDQGHSRLTDFGLARLDGAFYRDDYGCVLGSLAYLSPEQARGDSQWAKAPSDLYSLGVVLYELLTGRPPFCVEPTTNLKRFREQIERSAVDPPRTIDETIPAPLEAVCLKALAKDPSFRYATGADLAQALRAAMGPPRINRRRWLGTGAGLLALSAGLAALALWLWLSRFTREDSFRIIVKDSTGQHLLHEARRPLVDGVAMRVEVTLAKPGYVYVLGYSPDGTVDLHWPEQEYLETQEMVSEVRAPADVHNRQGRLEHGWLQLSKDHGYGWESIVALVMDNRLSQEDLARLKRIRLESSLTRGGQIRRETEVELGDKLAAFLAEELKVRTHYWQPFQHEANFRRPLP
jgi:serine/threonine protein kinase